MHIYTEAEAFEACKIYFEGDELASNVIVNKYLLRNNNGELLEKVPSDMHGRLSREFARIEKDKFKKPLTEEEIFALLDHFQYIVPAGSPMSSIGNEFQVQSLGNCFTLPPVTDSISGILYTDQQQAQLMKRRSGVGFDISNIRPKGLGVRNAARTTDGIGVFMERFSNTCREIAQNSRRGALLLCISVHHPEVETFINIKKDLKKVTGANISIKLTDEFMEAVKGGKEYEQRWPIDSESPSVRIKVDAKKIWNQIIESAWSCAEPGILFFSTIEKNSLAQHYKGVHPSFKESATNPCGEIHMGADSCRLMSINLYSYVKNPFTENAKFDFELFDSHVQLAQRLMDDVVDLEIEAINRIIKKIKSDPEPDYIKQVELDTWKMFLDNCRAGRRTGLGITALGDTLAALNMKYGSDESIKKVDKIFKQLAVSSLKSSCLMAKELGAFPLYDQKLEIDDPLLKRIFKASDEVRELHEKYGRRNISLTTCAPTGSVSCLTQTSSGIEPVFRLKYTRRRKINSEDKGAVVHFVDDMGDKWQEFTIFHHKLQKWMEVSGEKDESKSPFYKSTADDIDWEKSVDIQATAQKWISHSISKTCNIPNSASKELVSKIYLRAWESGCKGFTVYRDGCRSGVLIDKPKEKGMIQHTKAPKRPKTLPCDIHHVNVFKASKNNEYLVVVGLLHGEPYEVFAIENGHVDKKCGKGKLTKLERGHYQLDLENGTTIKHLTKETSDEEDALTRLISCGLRHGSNIEFIVEQLGKTSGQMFCFSKAIARALKHYIKDGTKVNGEKCESCGAETLVRKEGCKTCTSCGWSGCS